MANKKELLLTRRQSLLLLGAEIGTALCPALAKSTSLVSPQPYFAAIARAAESLARLGAPLSATDAQQISALASRNDVPAVEEAERILERYTLVNLRIELDGSTRIIPGAAPRTLIEKGWRMYLVRVENHSGRPNSISLSAGFGMPGRMWREWSTAQRPLLLDTVNNAPLIEKMWLLSEVAEATSVVRLGEELRVIPLSGIPVEYGVVQLYSRDHGQRRADFTAYTVPASGDNLGGSGHRELEFDCLPSRTVNLSVLDMDGRSCVAALTIRDKFNRVYPPQAMRIAPDMSFQPQIYRADGETVRLPDGEYTVESMRGPEYLRSIQVVAVEGEHSRIDVKLERWIDPGRWGWFSGDTHVHAGGCAHYQLPTEGVSPETMIRQVRGEGLSIGDVLTWGPSWYYQKQFFTGHAVSPAATLEHPELQKASDVSLEPHATTEDRESLVRYDVEVSGFPSSHAGHLVLLRLKEQDYPGAKLIEDWPSWNLPILKWVKAQGAVGGYAHCGLGMQVESTELPNYEIPPMDGIGTQEAIIDVTHGVVDFLSGCDSNPVAELNAWYHMLNCGFRMAMIGETDYPCMSGDRVGVGRTYVRMSRRPIDDAGYEEWIRGLQQGRLYCGDGRSHFLEFSLNGHRAGDGDVVLGSSGTVHVEALVAARLEPHPTPESTPKRVIPPGWGWHTEWARIGQTRKVSVELVINGVAVDEAKVLADGEPQAVKFKASIARSSWLALRIMPAAHTHPIFVQIAGKPVRASRRSADWCRKCVDKVWEVKSPFMREAERSAAADAFDHARRTYESIAVESLES